MYKLVRNIVLSLSILFLVFVSNVTAEIDTQINTNTTAVVNTLKNRVYPIKGYFFQYGNGAYDWCYLQLTTKRLFKLEGMEQDTGYLIWTEIPYKDMNLTILYTENLFYLTERKMIDATSIKR